MDRVPIINSSDVYAKNIEKLVSKLIHQREQNDILEKKLDESIFELYNIDYNYRSIILKDIENMIGLKKGGNNV